MEEQESYIVHQNTMLLLPKFTEYNEPVVDVYEAAQKVTVPGKSTDIVKESCSYYGASLGGRQEGTRAVTDYDKLLPIAVSPDWDLYMFPIGSPSKETGIWAVYHHIDQVKYDANPKKCMLRLSNGEKVSLEVSGDRVKTQLFRTGHFKSKLSRRLPTG